MLILQSTGNFLFILRGKFYDENPLI